MTLRELGLIADAKAALERALKIVPRYADAISNLALCMRDVEVSAIGSDAPLWLQGLLGPDFFCPVEKVTAKAPQALTNDHLLLLQAFPSLKCLDLSGTQITDEGVQHLTALKKLLILHLGGTQITDKW